MVVRTKRAPRTIIPRDDREEARDLSVVADTDVKFSKQAVRHHRPMSRAILTDRLEVGQRLVHLPPELRPLGKLVLTARHPKLLPGSEELLFQCSLLSRGTGTEDGRMHRRQKRYESLIADRLEDVGEDGSDEDNDGRVKPERRVRDRRRRWHVVDPWY